MVSPPTSVHQQSTPPTKVSLFHSLVVRHPMILRHLCGARDLLLSSLSHSTLFAAPVLVTTSGRRIGCPSATCIFKWTHKGWRAFAIVSVGNVAHHLSRVNPLLNWPRYFCCLSTWRDIVKHPSSIFTLRPPIARVSVLVNSCPQWMSLLQRSPDWVTCLYSCSSYTISKHTDTVSIWPSVLNLLLYQVGLSVCIWFFVLVTSSLKYDRMSTENPSQIISAQNMHAKLVRESSDSNEFVHWLCSLISFLSIDNQTR